MVGLDSKNSKALEYLSWAGCGISEIGDFKGRVSGHDTGLAQMRVGGAGDKGSAELTVRTLPCDPLAPRPARESELLWS